MKSDLVEIEGLIKSETDKAILFHDGDSDTWLPKSHVDFEYGEPVSIVSIPEWLAIEKGLV